MKNTLSITTNCVCTCVDSIADGTNRIFVAYNVGNAINPTFKMWEGGTLQSETALTAGQINYIEIPTSLFTANAVITFQYVDSSYTGKVFTINFPAELVGSLSVNKISDYVFTAKYTKTGGQSITVDSELSTTSANPVENKAITAALNDKQDKITVDAALSTTSENPVQNKVVTENINTLRSNIINRYDYYGEFVNSGESSVKACGHANINVYENGIVEIHFGVMFSAQDKSATDIWDWGINRDYFTSIVGGQIQPITGGIITFYNADGTLNTAATGYCGIGMARNQFWEPGRVYTTDGAVGGWAASFFDVGDHIVGTCYGYLQQ